MKTRLGALLLAAFVVLTIAGSGCNGANDVTGVNANSADSSSKPTPSYHPRPTPGPCSNSQHPEDCDP